jgi:hypothetical protein
MIDCRSVVTGRQRRQPDASQHPVGSGPLPVSTATLRSVADVVTKFRVLVISSAVVVTLATVTHDGQLPGDGASDTVRLLWAAQAESRTVRYLQEAAWSECKMTQKRLAKATKP